MDTFLIHKGNKRKIQFYTFNSGTVVQPYYVPLYIVHCKFDFDRAQESKLILELYPLDYDNTYSVYDYEPIKQNMVIF